MSHEMGIVSKGDQQSSAAGAVALVSSRVPISIRIATLDDLAFIDSLQKKHSKQLGFFPRAQMEGYLKNEWVLIAEERHEGTQAQRHEGEDKGNGEETSSAFPSVPSCLSASVPSPVGYVAWRDRYQKRDELGAIFQLCVSDGVRRKLVGAMLVKAAFERSAYGCRLFCCWCAQDIDANRFWESLGFVPLAFRSGSRAKGAKGQARVHIFWQKRIKAGDTQTPYWFPSQTGGGSIREDRLVLPIPPGTHWSDAKPIILPALSGVGGPGSEESGIKALPSPRKKKEKVVTLPPGAIEGGGLRFGSFQASTTAIVKPKCACPEQGRREKKQAQKHAPQLIAAARELRDRWMEQVNDGRYQIESTSKYDVCRLESTQSPRSGRIEDARIQKNLLVAA